MSSRGLTAGSIAATPIESLAIADNSSDSYIHKEYDEAVIYIDKDKKIADTIIKKHRKHWRYFLRYSIGGVCVCGLTTKMEVFMKKFVCLVTYLLLLCPFVCKADGDKCSELNGVTIDAGDVRAPTKVSDYSACCDLCMAYSGCEAAVVDRRKFCHLKNSTIMSIKPNSIVLMEPTPTTAVPTTAPPIPHPNWQASSGIYEDATNQTHHYYAADGVVVDTFTGIQWEQAASNSTMSWSDANSYCASRTTGGHQGWRLPIVQELQSLVDYTVSGDGTFPCINATAFPNTPKYGSWSATPMASGARGGPWFVSFGANCDFGGAVTNSRWDSCGNPSFVRCIYGNIIPPVTDNRYDNASTTNVVKDLVTGLMWERHASSSDMSWQNAIEYCTTQNTSGFSGWQLPTVKELLTLINYNITPGDVPTMNQDVFVGEPVDLYWSSTPVFDDSALAWFVGFSDGYVAPGGNGGVRCCRGL